MTTAQTEAILALQDLLNPDEVKQWPELIRRRPLGRVHVGGKIRRICVICSQNMWRESVLCIKCATNISPGQYSILLLMKDSDKLDVSDYEMMEKPYLRDKL